MSHIARRSVGDADSNLDVAVASSSDKGLARAGNHGKVWFSEADVVGLVVLGRAPVPGGFHITTSVLQTDACPRLFI